MTVLGADAVEQAARGETATLTVAAGDVLTPLAAERARDLGVEIVRGGAPETARRAPSAGWMRGETAGTPTRSAASGAPVARAGGPAGAPVVRFDQPPPVPFSPALYRRGAPIGGRRQSAPARTRTARVVVLGAGHVGGHTATRIAETDLVEEVVLVDIVDGLAAGVALDITHASGLLGFTTRVRGTTSVADAGRADVTVITAGRARQPGMSRTDLVTVNAGIVGALAAEVGRTSPDGVILVVSNPLDEMTEHAWRVSGLPPERVIGMAGVLDTARFQALIGLSTRIAAKDVRGWALGSHGDEMVIPLSAATAAGRALDEIVDADIVGAAVSRARDSGAEVVALLKTGSASITPGLAAARMVRAMLRDDSEVLPATVRPTGQYGLRDVYIGLPARIGRHGVTEIVELPLAERELTALRTAAASVRGRVAALGTK